MSHGLIAVWDIGSGKLIHELDDGVGYASSMALAPDGRTIAVAAGHTRTIRLWNLRSGKVARTLTVLRNEMVSAAFSPDRRLVAGGTASLDVHTEGDVVVWDSLSGRRKWLRNLPGAYVLRLVFSKTGDRIFGGLAHWRHADPGASQPVGEIAAWDTATGKWCGTWTGGSESVSGLRLSPDGRLLAYCGFGNDSQGRANAGVLAIVDAKTLKTRHVERQSEPVIDAVFSRDGKLLAVATESTVRIVPVSTLLRGNER